MARSLSTPNPLHRTLTLRCMPPARRTRCSLAVLAAFGLLAAGGPVLGATPGTVLPVNTLPVLRGLVSDYSKSATFTYAPIAGAGQSLTVQQLLPKIILDWNNFNIGNGSRVEFVQPSSTAAVLNRIYDKDPSIIQGQIKANGQVFLVNQNGILFDRGTQIDVNTLVASSLNIDDAVFQKGMTSGGLFTPAFSGGYDSSGKTVAGTTSSAIVIGANGASTAPAPKITAQTGGAIVLIAPVVDNQSGVIASPDGQVILAAGTSVYLGFSDASDVAMRGMLVEVTAGKDAVDLSNLIRNRSAGSLSADRGNVTLAGLAINQEGRVSASSALLTNGSIYLQARTLNDTQRGTVTLAAGSVTETPLDTSDKTTLRESDSYDPYRAVVKIQGAQIVNEGTITSPSGKVTLDAKDPTDPSAARIYLAAGSSIDASGAWSEASDASNLLTFKVTSNELKNSPDQKAGVLRGATVTVDLRAGSSLLDLSGYQANQARTLVQKAAAGGSVQLSSTGDVIERTDASINVSGGGVHYSGGTEATTKLIGADGKIYDIGTAPEALQYTAIGDKFVQTQARWGYSQTFNNLLLGASTKRPDYVQGAAGGALGVTLTTAGANNGLVLDGTLLGGATTGSQQLGAAPRGGTLTLGAVDEKGNILGIGDVTFRNGVLSSLPAGFDSGTVLGDDNKAQLNLSTTVFSPGAAAGPDGYATTGFSSLNVYVNGSITVPEGVAMQGPIGGALTLKGNQINVDGKIAIPSGSVNATVGAGAASDNGIVVAHGASIETRGTWTNNFISGAGSSQPSGFVSFDGSTVQSVNGGSITLSGPTVELQSGSVLDVSAGGSVSARGAPTGGAAGTVSLAASAPTGGSPLLLDGSLLGFGFGTGGVLNLSTGGAARVGSGIDPTIGLNLDAGFFDAGGFQKYSVAAQGNLLVDEGPAVHLQQQSLQFVNTQALSLPSGSDVAGATQRVLLPDDTRKPASLALASIGGELTLQTGSAVTTDVGGSVSLSGASGVHIDGAVTTPGGAISVTLKAADQQAVAPALELGSHGVLAARGSFTPKPSDQQLVQGVVSAGGTVSLTAQKATLQLDAGSVVDVSGARQGIDIPTRTGAQTPYDRSVQSSNAGTVSITADDAVRLGGALRGNADSNAAGGSFALTFTERSDFADPTSGRRIVVTQSGTPFAASASFKDAAVSVDKLAGGGFDKLRLTSEDQIVFASDATLRFDRGLTLDTKLLQVANDSTVAVGSVNVKLANSFGEHVPTSPGDNSDPRSKNDPTLASLPQATTTGKGSFNASATTLDVFGSVTIGGTQTESLNASGDLRLSGRTVGTASTTQGASLTGALTVGGDLSLSAAQIYPTTASTFTIAVADGLTRVPTADGRIAITANGSPRGDVFSAGGSLTLVADSIDQGGVVKAPLGSLALQSGKTLTLGPNSITSVSAEGLTIPYGETQAGVTWTYAAKNSNPLTGTLTAPPSKHIALTAPAIDMSPGATVDVSGGGDVASVEFVPGSGGAKDALIQPNTYAILPASKLASVPIDPDLALTQNLGTGSDGGVYNSIRIGPGSAVAAGDYVLLPGYYGLLKGGYVVQLLPGATYAALQPGQTATLQNGLTVVPGVMTAMGTDVASSATLGVVVRPNTDITKLADYTVTNAAYFAALADKNRTAEPRLPTDGGQLAIAASQRLTLQGNLVASLPSDSARSAEVDIAASKIALVDNVGRGDIASDYLQIDSASLSKLDASLLIGGVRSSSADGLMVTPTATDIIVANSSATSLKAPELILAATDTISVQAGSRIDGGGTRAVKGEAFTIGGSNAGSGAVLRVANSGLVDIKRSDTVATQGTVSIAAGATVASSGSLALDATRTTTSQGTLAVAAGGALALVSGSLSLGDTVGLSASDGLVLNNAQLAGFNTLGTLSLKSYHGIDLYGQTSIGSSALQDLVLDAGSITGHVSASGVPASALVSAGQVLLQNSSGGSGVSAAAGSGAGSFSVVATQITLGAGDKTVSGYAGTQLKASSELVASGIGSLQAASALQLQAARIGSVSGANQTWEALDSSDATAPVYRPVSIGVLVPATALADSTALGSRLNIVGSSIADGGNIVMKSGSVTLQALGSASGDGVQLLSGAQVDAGGAAKDFKGSTAIANAGQVVLTAANGAVQVNTGASVNVAAAAQGGDAGYVAITAQTAALEGTLLGSAARGQQGSFSLDVATLSDFSALNGKLNAAGLTESRSLRVRSGDITVATGDLVQAHQLVLASDTGTVAVNGKLDASASLGGGSVALYGANVSVGSGATIDASGTSTAIDVASAGSIAATVAPYANGGNVAMVAEGGTLSFASGAVIDVRAGAKGSAGEVLFRAPRSANGVQASLTGQVLSQRHGGDTAADVVVEGNRVYGPDQTGSIVTADMMGGYAADNQAFMSSVSANGSASAIASGLRGDDGAAQGHVHVRPAVEVRAAGDLTIADTWDLTGDGWRVKPTGGSMAEAGSLVVRAAGDLTLAGASVGNPDNTLQQGATWNIGLVSGADLGAANPLQTQSSARLAAQAASGKGGPGDLVLDSQNAEASVRTGTGNIQLAAGRDFVIKAGTEPDPNTGLIPIGVVYTAGRAAITDPLTAPEDSRFTQGGGNVSVSAQRDAVGAGNEWMTEWFRSATDNDGNGTLTTGAWWAYRPNFHDGVAALGGGNVSVTAGNDIRGLSAWVPSSGLEIGSGPTGSLQTFGGGDLKVQAGNDIVGGQYMASLGNASLDAGGRLGSTDRPSQLLMMGASGDTALAASHAHLSAGRGIDLSTIDNPSSLYQTQSFGDAPSFNFGNKLAVLSYSASGAVSLVAKGGDIHIGNRPFQNLTLSPDDQFNIETEVVSDTTSAAILPASVAVAAFSGDIVYTGNAGGLTLFPSAAGGVKLFAGKGISELALSVSDADPSQFAIQNVPTNGSTIAYSDKLQTLPSTPNRLVTNTSTDTFVNDVVALDGSIKGVTFRFPERARVWAAEDIIDPVFSLQNLSASDQTQVIADTGQVLITRPDAWGVGGPGSLLIQAGQNVDLGSAQVTSYGNQKNQSLLDAHGADITVLAGASGKVDLSKLDAAFAALVKAGSDKKPDDATTAVNSFFASATVGKGNIDSYGTSIQSNAGGSVNMLAPGGDITVGLTTPGAKLIGVVTNAGGAIRSYLSGNFDINQGKVLTAQGGDILIYTSEGGIDAGRGAKTSVTTPPPTRTPVYDSNQNLIGYTYTLPVAVAGSGIQTATSKPGGPTSVAPPAGNIYLFAPAGTIDAGEAGIASGGNIFIAALTVLNADNISSVGTSVGVPPVVVGSVASTVASSGATTAANAGKDSDAAAQAAAAQAAAQAAGAGFKPAILTVEVLGFGEKNCKETDKDCFAK